MASELQPASLVSQLARISPVRIFQGYYRSKLFIAPFSSNPLVAAAGPVFSILERLCVSPSLPPILEIRDNIEHELKAFHSRLEASEHPIDIISIAHYLLCTTIDELLGKNYLRVYNHAPNFAAFTPLTSDGTEPQTRFFEILNFIKDRPNQYLDLIELTYYCLIVGFEGQFHLTANVKQSLDNYTEELYQLIQQFRFNKSHRLFNENHLPKTVKSDYKNVMVTSVIAATLVICSFFVSRILLENKADNVLFGHSQLAMLDN